MSRLFPVSGPFGFVYNTRSSGPGLRNAKQLTKILSVDLLFPFLCTRKKKNKVRHGLIYTELTRTVCVTDVYLKISYKESILSYLPTLLPTYQPIYPSIYLLTHL